jgi:hypothetical protein
MVALLHALTNTASAAARTSNARRIVAVLQISIADQVERN